MPPFSVAFYVPEERNVKALRGLDCDSDWKAFIQGERCWILQTYLRLRDAGLPVDLTSSYPEAEIVVVHPYFLSYLLKPPRGKTIPIVVLAADDKGFSDMVDFQIVQNRLAADDRSFHIPLWPQPGLVPRDPARGTQVKKVGYKGFDVCLHEDLRGPEWVSALEDRGLVWEEDSFRALDRRFTPDQLHWNDYSETDVIVALRPPDPDLYPHKPATKLILAWLAGVPAVLGAESAYRNLRRSELDYIEVNSAAEALAAIDRLRSSPELYRDMVANGVERSREHGVEATLERWREVLFEEIPAHLASQGNGLLRENPGRQRTCWWWSSKMRWKRNGAKAFWQFVNRFR